MLLEKLLSMIKCTKVLIGDSWSLYNKDEADFYTSGNAYRITLSYHGKRCSFVFHDNFKNESNKRDFVKCLILDAEGYDNNHDYWQFCRAFYGFTNDRQARKAYAGCKAQSERLHRLFNQNEIDILSTIE